ncbi:MAG: tetratricopeptide repeat protein [Candidatus Aminicenantaceae bacterium]
MPKSHLSLNVCLVLSVLLVFSCVQTPEDAAPAAAAQAVSLLGEELYAAESSAAALEQYAEAKKNFDQAPESADALIWYGRRTAYLGQYREAIEIYTEGIKQFPEDARFFRHRGHRYISVREFDKAIEDFEQAAALIEGTEDTIEPDGMPNARNIPVSSLHSNIWYHFGLACYLTNDLDNALRAYRAGLLALHNDDNRVSLTHWLYMTLRLLGRDDEAKEALVPIHSEMDIIENSAYHKLCLFYKGELTLEDLSDPEFSTIMDDAVAYGVGSWYFYCGDRDRAKAVFEEILARDSWASFGYIAAEADYVRAFR